MVEVARARGFEEPPLKCETVVHRLPVRPERAERSAPPIEELERVEHQARIRDADKVCSRADPATVVREEFSQCVLVERCAIFFEVVVH